MTSSSRSPDEAEAAAGPALLEVISHLVHELRTPLTVIAGYAALLGESGSEPAPADFVDAIARNATVIQRRLDLLADTEEVLRSGLRVQCEPCDLGELVEDVVHGYALELEHNPVRIEVLVDEKVAVDRRRLAQAIGHLLGNAARFSPAHAPIEICVAADSAGATITVRDHGPGVPEHLRPLLFRRFAETGPGTKSMGLGLFLSRSIVDAHGGTVRYEPAPGGGASFIIQLPSASGLGHADEPPLLPRTTVQPPAPSPTATVLHFEDDRTVAALVQRMLGAVDIAVISATSAAAGADLVQRHRPDVVLLDLQLGQSDGEDVLRALRNDPRTATTPVVIVSGGLTAARTAHLFDAGADAVLPKPFGPEELRTTVRGVLEAGDEPDGSTPHEPPADEAPLDLRYIEALEELGDDLDGGATIADLVATMVTDASSYLSSLHHAAADGDLRQAARLAHCISGSIGNLGAHLVVQACVELQAAADAGDAEGITRLVDRVSVTLRDAEAALAARSRAPDDPAGGRAG